MPSKEGRGGSGSRELYSVRADILGDERGNSDMSELIVPFNDGRDSLEDIAKLGGRKETFYGRDFRRYEDGSKYFNLDWVDRLIVGGSGRSIVPDS
jgi:hypothetical protein